MGDARAELDPRDRLEEGTADLTALVAGGFEAGRLTVTFSTRILGGFALNLLLLPKRGMFRDLGFALGSGVLEARGGVGIVQSLIAYEARCRLDPGWDMRDLTESRTKKDAGLRFR